MKKENRRIIKILMAFSFVFSLFFLTPDNFLTSNSIKEVQAEVAPCSVYGTHRMHAHSPAVVKYKGTNKNAIGTNGTLYQCACGSSIAVTGWPPASPLNTFVTDPTPVLGFAGAVSYETPKSNVRYTSGYSLPGYRFY